VVGLSRRALLFGEITLDAEWIFRAARRDVHFRAPDRTRGCKLPVDDNRQLVVVPFSQ
jgi:hypothetical protein